LHHLHENISPLFIDEVSREQETQVDVEMIKGEDNKEINLELHESQQQEDDDNSSKRKRLIVNDNRRTRKSG
jgi:hypothetical protein